MKTYQLTLVEGASLLKAIKGFTRTILLDILTETNNHSKAAKYLGMNRTTLIEKMRALGIDLSVGRGKRGPRGPR